MGFIAKWEWANKPDGGYTLDPTDLGGETKWGISKRAHPNDDIKNLTPDRACEIYANDYWDKCGCDDIPFPLNTVVFDSAVQHGPARALGWLKASTSCRDYIEMRKQFYYSIVNKNPPQIRFMRGWMNRLSDLQKFVDINSPESVV